MEISDKTAMQMFFELKNKPTSNIYGFGEGPCRSISILQKAYTSVGEFVTAYEDDPDDMDYVNRLAELARARKLPVAWTDVAFTASGEDRARSAAATTCRIYCRTSSSGTAGPSSTTRAGDRPRQRHHRQQEDAPWPSTRRRCSPSPSSTDAHTVIVTGLFHLGLRVCYRGRQPVARLPHHRAGGVRGRPARSFRTSPTSTT